MTSPTYAQLSDPTQAGPGFAAETYPQRLLTIISMIASGQNPDGTPLSGGGTNLTLNGVVYATGVVTDGATDNFAYLQALVNGLPSTGGHIIFPSGPIGMLQPLSVTTPGVHFWGTSKLQPTPDPGGLVGTPIGTYFTCLPGFAIGSAPQNAQLYIGASNFTATYINWDCAGATVKPGYNIYVDGAAVTPACDCTLDHCSWQGLPTVACVTLPTGAARSNFISCYGNNHGNATLPVVDWHAADGKIIDCRFKDGVKNFNGAGNMNAIGGHWTGGTPGVNITGGGAIHLKDILFDSPNNAVIVHGGTNVCDISDCDFYQQSNIGGFTAVQKTNAQADIYLSNVNVNCTSGAEYSHLWSGLGGDDIVWGVNNNNVAGGTTSILGALSADGTQPGIMGWYIQGNNAVSYNSTSNNPAAFPANIAYTHPATLTLCTVTVYPGLWMFTGAVTAISSAATAGLEIVISAGTATLVGFGAGSTAGAVFWAPTATAANGTAVLTARCTVAGTVTLSCASTIDWTINTSNSTSGPNVPLTYLNATYLTS